MSSFLQGKFVYGLTVVLVLQAVLFYSASHGELTPLAAPLSTFPIRVDAWSLKQEGVVDNTLFASSVTGVSVDCEECGAYAITPDAIHRLGVRPVARPGVRFEIFRLRSNGHTPRPSVDLKMVEHFCTGYTPMRG